MDRAYWDVTIPNVEMRLRTRGSSEGRSWTGFDAAIFDTSGGYVHRPPTAAHHVVMHVGVPIRAVCQCDGPAKERYLVAGEADIVPAGCDAAWEDAGPSTILSINLSQALLRETADRLRINTDVVRIVPSLQVRDPQLEHIAWAIKAEIETPSFTGRLFGDCLGTALAAHLLSRYSTAKNGARSERGLSNRQIRRIDEYITENLDRDLSLAELSRVLGMGSSHFKVLFRTALGVPVHQYVIKQRVDRAAHMLSRPGATISEVALYAGFADPSHMARWMRRLLGVTPSEIRQATR